MKPIGANRRTACTRIGRRADRWALTGQFVYDRFSAQNSVLTDETSVPKKAHNLQCTSWRPLFRSEWFLRGFRRHLRAPGPRTVAEQRSPSSARATATSRWSMRRSAIGCRRGSGSFRCRLSNIFDEGFDYQDDSYRESQDFAVDWTLHSRAADPVQSDVELVSGLGLNRTSTGRLSMSIGQVTVLTSGRRRFGWPAAALGMAVLGSLWASSPAALAQSGDFPLTDNPGAVPTYNVPAATCNTIRSEVAQPIDLILACSIDGRSAEPGPDDTPCDLLDGNINAGISVGQCQDSFPTPLLVSGGTGDVLEANTTVNATAAGLNLALGDRDQISVTSSGAGWRQRAGLCRRGARHLPRRLPRELRRRRGGRECGRVQRDLGQARASRSCPIPRRCRMRSSWTWSRPRAATSSRSPSAPAIAGAAARRVRPWRAPPMSGRFRSASSTRR